MDEKEVYCSCCGKPGTMSRMVWHQIGDNEFDLTCNACREGDDEPVDD